MARTETNINDALGAVEALIGSKSIQTNIDAANDATGLSDHTLTEAVQSLISRQPEIYEGTYTVAPSFDAQTLETKDKYLENDVTVEPIEVSRTSNPSGGTTIYIGGDING